MEDAKRREAVELLQELGLKQYESKCFVALARIGRGTAKEISEASEVPRTRVYDAIRVLETKGLVEIQHSNPQQFRPVDIDEAVATLRTEYENRAEELRDALSELEPAVTEGETPVHEVWSLTGKTAIENRTVEFIDDADEEVMFVAGTGSVTTGTLFDRLQAADKRGVELVVGVADADIRSQFETALPNTNVFISGLEWLEDGVGPEDRTQVTRLLLIDGTNILVSTRPGDGGEEYAVIGHGFDNGVVTIARRLMTTGLVAGGHT